MRRDLRKAKPLILSIKTVLKDFSEYRQLRMVVGTAPMATLVCADFVDPIKYFETPPKYSDYESLQADLCSGCKDRITRMLTDQCSCKFEEVV